MVEPPLSELLKKVDTRYTLCIVAGKRARQLTDGAPVLVRCDSQNPITIASHELDESMITYRKKNSKAQSENTCYKPCDFDQA